MATLEGTYPEGKRSSLLAGVRILDMAGGLAGPFSTMLLADMGAEVVNLEPLGGDGTRRVPPYFVDGDSAYFLSINRNKKSIAIDLKSDEGRQVLDRLLVWADVVVDNLRLEKRKKIGLEYERISAVNPALVSCSLTGFGSDGPYSARPAMDIVVEAMAGVMSLTGPVGGPSVRAGVPIGDLVAGMYMSIGVLAGLQHKNATGVGRHIDISMLDSQISLLSYLGQFYIESGVVPTHQGRGHVSSPTYDAFATRDGEVVIAAESDGAWQGLCKTLGLTDLLDDPRCIDRRARLEHREVVSDALTGAFAQRETQEVYEALNAADVPCAPINSVDAALRDPQVAHRDMVVSVRRRDGGDFVTLGSVLKVDGDADSEFFAPPALGANTDEILAEVGFSAAEIELMRSAGALRSDEKRAQVPEPTDAGGPTA